MPGEIWRSIFQVGKETTAGTAVAATRAMYWEQSGSLNRDRAVNLIRTSTGTRDNTRDAKLRAVTAGGSISQPMSADEIVELLLMTVKGGVTPTQLQAAAAPTQPGAGTALTAGTLATGNYFYGYTLTATSGTGVESQPAFTAAALAVTGPTGSITTASVTVPAGSIARFYLSTTGGATGTARYTGVSIAATGTAVLTAVPAATQPLPPASANSGIYQWTFTPGNTLDTATVEWRDGAVDWQQRGVLCDELKLAGTVGADDMITGTLFGREMVQNALTGSLTQRVPDFMEGWEAKLYIDAFGGTAGTTNIPGTMVAYDFDVKNNAGRKYFADNTTATGSVTMGQLDITMDLTLEANASALTEYTNRETAVKRLVRFELGNNFLVPGQNTYLKKVWIDVPGVWTTIDLTQSDANTRVYRFHFDSVYDPTNAYSLQITALNNRATAW